MGAPSKGELLAALARIGEDPDRRRRMVELLRQLEPELARDGLNVREEITGPIVNALHREAGIIKRRLQRGVEIQGRYQSKIVRDFVMADANKRASPAADPLVGTEVAWSRP